MPYRCLLDADHACGTCQIIIMDMTNHLYERIIITPANQVI